MREFTDSHGCLRRGNQWGYNSFASEQGARANAKAVRRRGTRVRIWRLPDGTFDWTGIRPEGLEGPDGPIDYTRPAVTEIGGCELIGEMTT